MKLSATWTVFVVMLFPTFLVGRGVSPPNSPQATNTSITISWIAPGDDGWMGQADMYDVRYSLSYITEENFISSFPVGMTRPKPSGKREYLTIENLTPNTSYYFALKTRDQSNNWSKISNCVSKKTTGD